MRYNRLQLNDGLASSRTDFFISNQSNANLYSAVYRKGAECTSDTTKIGVSNKSSKEAGTQRVAYERLNMCVKNDVSTSENMNGGGRVVRQSCYGSSMTVMHTG